MSARNVTDEARLVAADLKGDVRPLGQKQAEQSNPAAPIKKSETPGAPPQIIPQRISFFKLFRYSGCCQKTLVTIGILSSVISGAAAPTIAIVFGEIVGIFNPTNTDEEINDGIIKLIKLIGVLCAILWVFGYLQYACL